MVAGSAAPSELRTFAEQTTSASDSPGAGPARSCSVPLYPAARPGASRSMWAAARAEGGGGEVRRRVLRTLTRRPVRVRVRRGRRAPHSSALFASRGRARLGGRPTRRLVVVPRPAPAARRHWRAASRDPGSVPGLSRQPRSSLRVSSIATQRDRSRCRCRRRDVSASSGGRRCF